MPKLRNPNGPYWQAIRAAERVVIIDTLMATGGDLKRAATLLGIARNYLRARCYQLQVDVDLIRGNGKHYKSPPPPATETASSWLTTTDVTKDAP